MPLVTSVRMVARAFGQFAANGCSQMGAALSYYALFSTAPLLILAVLLAGIFFGEESARARVRDELTRTVGPASAREVTALMERPSHPATGVISVIVGAIALILGALAVFLHVRQCLAVIWRLEPPQGSGLLGTLLNYALAIVMVLCSAALLLLSLAISTALPAVARYLGEDVPGGTAFWHWIDAASSFILLTLFYALVFRVMSGGVIKWRHVVYGALLTALLFTIGKTLIGWYLAYSSMASAYGAAASLVVFLVWLYYSSQIFFFGAELVQAWRTRGEWLVKRSGETTPERS